MPRFIVVHTAPFTEEDLLSDVKTVIAALTADFSWKLTYCDFDDNKFFCEWKAPSKEALEQVFMAANMSYDEIYPVRLLDVAKAQFIPEDD